MHSGPSASGASCSTAGFAIVSECSAVPLFTQERSREAVPGWLISGQSKSQQRRFNRKGAHMDTMASQSLDDVDRFGMADEAEQRRSAEHSKACSVQHRIEPLPISLKSSGRYGEPLRVAERRPADPQRGTRNSPWSQLSAHAH